MFRFRNKPAQMLNRRLSARIPHPSASRKLADSFPPGEAMAAASGRPTMMPGCHSERAQRVEESVIPCKRTNPSATLGTTGAVDPLSV